MNKANNIDIPVPQWKPNKVINEKVARFPDSLTPELEVFHLSFKYYNDELCEVQDLIRNNARAALEDFKVIGRCNNLKSLQDKGIDLTAVRPSGDYKRLFTKQITDDIQLKEHKIQGDARIFYFIVEKSFNIVAITSNHYETHKNK